MNIFILWHYHLLTCIIKAQFIFFAGSCGLQSYSIKRGVHFFFFFFFWDIFLFLFLLSNVLCRPLQSSDFRDLFLFVKTGLQLSFLEKPKSHEKMIYFCFIFILCLNFFVIFLWEICAFTEKYFPMHSFHGKQFWKTNQFCLNLWKKQIL